MEFIFKDFLETAKLLSEENLVYSYVGNLSRKWKEKLFITRTGISLRNLSEEDIIVIPFDESSILEERASSEINIHKELIKRSGKNSVVHTHPIYTVLLSFKVEKIEPVDSEGREALKSVPVVSEREQLSETININKIAVLKGHGVFSVGNSLLEAYELISILENSSKILWRLEYG